MIEVDFPAAVDGKVQLRVTGHSGSAERGKDVVCAAVSTLVQTFAGGIQACLNGEVSGNIDSGTCDLSLEVPETGREQLETVCKVFKFGFRKIAESYPEHVKLN